MVANEVQCDKPQIMKTIVRKVRRAHQVPRRNETDFSHLKERNQVSHTLKRQPFTDAKEKICNSLGNIGQVWWSINHSL